MSIDERDQVHVENGGRAGTLLHSTDGRSTTLCRTVRGRLGADRVDTRDVHDDANHCPLCLLMERGVIDRETTACPYCDFDKKDREQLADHLEDRHEDHF